MAPLKLLKYNRGNGHFGQVPNSFEKIIKKALIIVKELLKKSPGVLLLCSPLSLNIVDLPRLVTWISYLKISSFSPLFAEK